ncbi:hypothetical protein [Photobacterium leiognathi]|uniref:hypothetical protein n=1 Tax=Photobacterium leiognathi TaxID=553611 RepID=UPI000D17E260|nr:hypothetical protein [Photobacterium leiognathi]PSW44618.1 hypothetical protein C0W40_07380 [Photobacterium leiognathi subsp. mandapamensis]
MSPAKIYLRDLIGLAVVGMFILTALGVIFSIVGVVHYLTNANHLVAQDIQLAITHLVFIVPALLLGYAISRPQWIAATKQYRIEKARKESS